MTSFKYLAYGLRILSDVEFAGVSQTEFEAHDVRVEKGAVDPYLDALKNDADTIYETWRASKDYFCLTLDGVAKYLVLGGDRVIIDVAPGAQDEDVFAFFIGSAMAAILHQRGVLTLHASAIQTDHGAILFLGRSGAGKSTLSYAMQKRGFSMLSDDVAAIRFNAQGQAVVTPSLSTTRLWEDSLQQLEPDLKNPKRLRQELEKFIVPARTFSMLPEPIYKIYHLNPYNGSHITLSNLSSVEGLNAVTNFTYRRKFYLARKLAHQHFDAVTRLVNKVPMTRIDRPTRSFQLTQLTDLILADLEAMNAPPQPLKHA